MLLHLGDPCHQVKFADPSVKDIGWLRLCSFFRRHKGSTLGGGLWVGVCGLHRIADSMIMHPAANPQITDQHRSQTPSDQRHPDPQIKPTDQNPQIKQIKDTQLFKQIKDTQLFWDRSRQIKQIKHQIKQIKDTQLFWELWRSLTEFLMGLARRWCFSW